MHKLSISISNWLISIVTQPIKVVAVLVLFLVLNGIVVVLVVAKLSQAKAPALLAG